MRAVAIGSLGLMGAALIGWLIIGSPLTWSQPRHLDTAAWVGFAGRFTTGEGRVVDKDNGGITHTEALGYGLLMAEAADDHAAFDRIWNWTNSHLRRKDGLFSWKYGPCPAPSAVKPTNCVLDPNNASDGDVLIAWALLRASAHWHDADDHAAALALINAVRDQLIIRLGKRTLLLPGIDGFSGDHSVVVNPSYWIFPAFSAFAAATGDNVWMDLRQSGLDLVEQARFGSYGLPSDWVRVDADSVRPADGFDPRFGFNAVRVPLNIAWGTATAPLNNSTALLQPFLRFWHQNQPPAWIDVTSGETAPYAWSGGMQAIARLATGIADKTPVSPADLPKPTEADGYFSSSLILLSAIAASDISAASGQ